MPRGFLIPAVFTLQCSHKRAGMEVFLEFKSCKGPVEKGVNRH